MTNSINYIQKVEIYGLWGRYDIEWDLHSDVNVLAGINGSGKSTIISLIGDALFQQLRIDNLNERCDVVDKVKISLNDNRNVSCHKSKFKFHPNLGSLKEVMTNLIRTFDTELRSQELLQKVDKRVKTELDFELWKMQKEYLNYQVNLGKKLKSNKGNPDDDSTYFHDRFLEIVDNLFSETNKTINRDKNELEFLLDDKEISAYQLSSGEKQLLIILLTVLVQDNQSSILLMDEPEISLHIDWQNKLIDYIRELNPNAQIILATHSPGMIMDGWFSKVFELSDLIVKDRLAS